MAVVETGRTSNGVLYRICDDCYAGVPEEELERRREQAREASLRVALDITNQKLKEQRAAQSAQQSE